MCWMCLCPAGKVCCGLCVLVLRSCPLNSFLLPPWFLCRVECWVLHVVPLNPFLKSFKSFHLNPPLTPGVCSPRRTRRACCPGSSCHLVLLLVLEGCLESALYLCRCREGYWWFLVGAWLVGCEGVSWAWRILGRLLCCVGKVVKCWWWWWGNGSCALSLLAFVLCPDPLLLCVMLAVTFVEVFIVDFLIRRISFKD